jgi:hypothetical protein
MATGNYIAIRQIDFFTLSGFVPQIDFFDLSDGWGQIEEVDLSLGSDVSHFDIGNT